MNEHLRGVAAIYRGEANTDPAFAARMTKVNIALYSTSMLILTYSNFKLERTFFLFVFDVFLTFFNRFENNFL